jgi:hypothetical protein
LFSYGTYKSFVQKVQNFYRFSTKPKKEFFSEPGHQFNFDQWSSAVKTANEKMKILLGIPASRPAGEGYEPVENIKKIYDTIKSATNFAGKTCNCVVVITNNIEFILFFFSFLLLQV